YSPFEADVTDALKGDGENVLVVRAYDPTDPSLPTGKQVGWYTPTSGIWQTVWLESRPKAFLKEFAVRTAIDPASASFTVLGEGLGDGTYTLAVRSADPTVQPASITFGKSKGGLGQGADLGNEKGRGAVVIQVPVKEPKLWTPETPHLYEVTL